MSSLPIEIKKRSNELPVAEDLCRDMSSNNLFDCKINLKTLILQDFYFKRSVEMSNIGNIGNTHTR